MKIENEEWNNETIMIVMKNNNNGNEMKMK